MDFPMMEVKLTMDMSKVAAEWLAMLGITRNLEEFHQENSFPLEPAVN